MMASAAPRVLAIHRYYWPDTPPYASILRVIVQHWHESGVRTEVFSSQPSYKPGVTIDRRLPREMVDGTAVRRVTLPRDRGRVTKAFNMMMFTLAAAGRVLWRRRNVVMCSTSPPVVLGAAVSWAAKLRGARFVYHCMDLHPEIGALSGDFAQPLIYRLLYRLELGTCRRAAAIVVLSQDMRRAVLERDAGLDDRIVVLNNPDLPEFDTDPSKDAHPSSGQRLRVVFTGNLGRFQGLEAVVDGIRDLAHEADIELILMGDGAARADLVSRAESFPTGARASVTVLPHASSADARELMRTADLGLVTLQPGVIRLAYPSKTMTYLSEGLPLLVGVEADSELATTVRAEGIGFVLEALDAAAVRTTLLDLTHRTDEIERMRPRAAAYAARSGAREVVLKRWGELLDDLVATEVPT